MYLVPLSVRDLLLEVGSQVEELTYMANKTAIDQSETEKFEKYLSNIKKTLKRIFCIPSKSMMNVLIKLELQLTEISLNCHDINFADVNPIFERQKNLECVGLIDIQLTNTNLCDIGRTLPKLLELDIEFAVEPDVNITFLNTMPNLETLKINDYPQTQNADDLSNFKKCRSPKLKTIKLFAVQPSSWRDVRKYLKAASNLTSVTLGTCKFNSWFELFNTLPMTQLKVLSLHAITVPPKTCPYARVEYSVSLRHLELDLLSLSRETLQDLFRRCLHLETVSLARVRTFNDSVMLVLCQKLTHLVKLKISKCPITDTAVGYIIDHCAALEQLWIESCSRITQAGENRLEISRKYGSLRAIVTFKR